MKNKKFISVVIMLCVILSGCGSNPTTNTETKADKTKDNSILATGIVEAENQYTVSTSVMADILSDPFKEGDVVKSGTTLYVLEQKDFQNNISKARNAMASAQNAYDLNEDNIRKLSVTSDCSGTVTNIYVTTGNMVTAGAKIADVIDSDNMKLSVPFITETAQNIYVGQSAKVNIVGTFYELTGTVSHISTGQLTTANGSNVKMVEILVLNPGTLKKGDKGTATISGIACNDSGEFDYAASGTITAEIAGKVSQKHISVGDKVSVGTVAVTLTNERLLTQRKQYTLNISDAQLALNNLTNNLDNYNITSKINGTVIKKNVDKNDTLTAANISNLAVIADLSKIILKVNVDEMDVKKIKVGDTAVITSDADLSKEYSGKVEFVSETSTNTNGVALFEVRIYIEKSEDLMPGMNVTAKFNLN